MSTAVRSALGCEAARCEPLFWSTAAHNTMTARTAVSCRSASVFGLVPGAGGGRTCANISRFCAARSLRLSASPTTRSAAPVFQTGARCERCAKGGKSPTCVRGSDKLGNLKGVGVAVGGTGKPKCSEVRLGALCMCMRMCSGLGWRWGRHRGQRHF